MPSSRTSSASRSSRQAGHVTPAVGVAGKPPRHLVGGGDRGVAEDLEVAAVVGFQQGQQEKSDRVATEVRGDVADAEAAVRVGVVGMGPDRARPAVRRAARASAGVRRPSSAGVAVGVKVQGIEQVAVECRGVGTELDGAAVGGEGLVQQAHVLQDVTQVVVCVRQVGPQRQDLAITGERLVQSCPCSFRASPRLPRASGKSDRKRSASR